MILDLIGLHHVLSGGKRKRRLHEEYVRGALAAFKALEEALETVAETSPELAEEFEEVAELALERFKKTHGRRGLFG